MLLELSASCWRVRSGQRCRAVAPSGPLVCKAGRQRALVGCLACCAALSWGSKRAAQSSRPSWVVFAMPSVSGGSGTAEGSDFRRRQPPSSFEGCWGISLPLSLVACHQAWGGTQRALPALFSLCPAVRPRCGCYTEPSVGFPKGVGDVLVSGDLGNRLPVWVLGASRRYWRVRRRGPTWSLW